MIDVIDLMIDYLSTLNYPIIRQGSLSDEDAYPESFFTYWNNDTVDDEFFDNVETRTIWDLDLNFYSTDPDLVFSVLIEAKQLLKADGFIVTGNGYDVLSDEPTHQGRGMNIFYIQKVSE